MRSYGGAICTNEVDVKGEIVKLSCFWQSSAGICWLSDWIAAQCLGDDVLRHAHIHSTHTSSQGKVIATNTHLHT